MLRIYSRIVPVSFETIVWRFGEASHCSNEGVLSLQKFSGPAQHSGNKKLFEEKFVAKLRNWEQVRCFAALLIAKQCFVHQTRFSFNSVFIKAYSPCSVFFHLQNSLNEFLLRINLKWLKPDAAALPQLWIFSTCGTSQGMLYPIHHRDFICCNVRLT